MTGVNFAGLLYAHSTRTLQGLHALFTCGITCTLHLEFTVDLTAESFLQAFHHFASRRGLSSKMISDNAKTFMASARDSVCSQGTTILTRKEGELRIHCRESSLVGGVLGAPS